MDEIKKENLLSIFYGLAACSWMPHWACHYYRLETHSSFVVGSWSFSSLDSVIALFVYGSFILMCLLSISIKKLRVTAAGLCGIGHLALGLLHAYRILIPFKFEVFGYTWSYWATVRETLIVVPFGTICLFIAFKIYKSEREVITVRANIL